MRSRLLLSIVLTITTLVAGGCDNYEFPVSPYAKILTRPAENISKNGARFVGDLVKLDSEAITEHGFVWGFNENINIKSFDTLVLGSLSQTGVFSADVSGLNADATYFVRSFVHTGEYYIYGEAVSFKTSKK